MNYLGSLTKDDKNQLKMTGSELRDVVSKQALVHGLNTSSFSLQITDLFNYR